MNSYLFKKKKREICVQWVIVVIPELWRLTKEKHKFKASLGYRAILWGEREREEKKRRKLSSRNTD
jgi:hypothetical protein